MFAIWIIIAVLIALTFVIPVWKPLGFYGNPKRRTPTADTNERVNLALKISQKAEWSGPLRHDELWKAEIPGVTSSEIVAWNDLFRELKQFSIELGLQVVDQKIEEAEALRRIIEKYPQLDKDISKLYCRNSVYIAWRS